MPNRRTSVVVRDAKGNPTDKTVELDKLLLTYDEAADWVGVSAKTILRERQRRRIQGINLGRRVFIPYFELQRYVRALCDEQGVPLDEATLAG